ncbi:glutathione S-transferase family protein [Roseateles amylovorans]|uniref:Glutathione S-transferase family protein n=1 Tax=Roseateles amylovorans TaxID=2978473 RepID=A0ABY6B3J9_9BURK|nr:glutathione S-transferase family protein [Roseateles amylovorans]UXH79124.1 glutathione S-transferase family protein [Roseateles amylovorans]
MPPLTLHYHPLSSYCHKVLIALDELGVSVALQRLNLGDPTERAAYQTLWPMGKMPLLIDQGRPIPESSIIIEHLQRHHAAPGRTLIPDDVDPALTVRLWDRFFDQYVMTPMQACTSDLLRSETERDPLTVARAKQTLAAAYPVIEQQLEGKTWIAGDTFTMADCAAAPSLFYAVTYLPIPASAPRLSAYFERLMARPSIAATVDQARPFFQFYPGRAGLAPRFLESNVD